MSSVVTTASASHSLIRGSELVTLDAKGRISIPVKLRKGLLENGQGQAMLTRSPRGCVLLFPMAHWEAFCARKAEMETRGELPWEYTSQLSSEEVVELDEAARVNIPPKLRNVCHISKERDVYVIGMGTHLQLWDDATYESTLKGYRSDEKKDPNWDILVRLGI